MRGEACEGGWGGREKRSVKNNKRACRYFFFFFRLLTASIPHCNNAWGSLSAMVQWCVQMVGSEGEHDACMASCCYLSRCSAVVCFSSVGCHRQMPLFSWLRWASLKDPRSPSRCFFASFILLLNHYSPIHVSCWMCPSSHRNWALASSLPPPSPLSLFRNSLVW
jgi:hypothetical protein